MLDVLIQTYNEELNLPYTLESVAGWVNRVYIVDSGSTDRTAEIAESFGATIVRHEWEGYARQKNWALANMDFESPWTLILDADEAVSPELKQELLQLTSRPIDEVPEAGFLINRVFVFMGRRIRHCGYFPSWNLRLFKRGMARYEDRSVHEHMICDGPVGRLKHLLIHEDRRGLEHFSAKHNRYSTLEAQEIYVRPEPWPGIPRFFSDETARRRFVKSRVVPHLPLPFAWRLLYMYILRNGWLDGRAGWILSNLIASYEHLVQMKYRELTRVHGDRSGVRPSLAVAEGSLPLNVNFRKDSGAALKRHSSDSKEADSSGQSGKSSRNVRHEGIPTLVTRTGRSATKADANEDLRYVSPWTLRQNIGRVLWMFVNRLLFRPSFHNWYGWRRMLLRLFGAKIGNDVRLRPTVAIEIPWNVEIGDGTVVGDQAILYSLGKITIGKRVVISQYAHLCAGTHDYNHMDFPLLRPPIRIEDGVWVAADAFVGPNVTVGERSVIGARSSVFKSIGPEVIAAGNPARVIRKRHFDHEAPVEEAVGTSPELPEQVDGLNIARLSTPQDQSPAKKHAAAIACGQTSASPSGHYGG